MHPKKPLDLFAVRQRTLTARLNAVPNAFLIKDIDALLAEVEYLRQQVTALQAACTIGLPYAKGDGAEVLRQTIAHAKGQTP